MCWALRSCPQCFLLSFCLSCWSSTSLCESYVLLVSCCVLKFSLWTSVYPFEVRAYLNRCLSDCVVIWKRFGGNWWSFAPGLLLVSDSWIFALFSSSPVLASAVCLCCCHFDMSNRLVASLLFTHSCLFYFVFSRCCFDKPRTSFVCSVDYVKLEIYKVVDGLTFHYLHKSESWSFLPSTIFLEPAFPNAVMWD